MTRLSNGCGGRVSARKLQIIEVPPLAYAMIGGEGDPNTDARFEEAVGALYAVSYGIKMLPKKGAAPKGYFEYKVSALEGDSGTLKTARRLMFWRKTNCAGR